VQYRFHLTVAAALHGKAPLTQTAVEMLESKSDQRYKYFNAKIQTLVKRRIILEEMQRATQKLVKNELL
jgi:hypothetical protein